MELQLQQVQVSIGDLREGHSQNQGSLDQILGYLSNQEQSLGFLQRRAQQYFTNTSLTGTSGNDSRSTYSITPPSRISDAPSSHFPPLSGSTSSNVHLRLARRLKCQSTCTCSCHRKAFHKSPYLLKNVLGFLFIGYAGLHVSSNPCDTSNCQTNTMMSFQSCYVFPSWLLNWAVYLTATFTKTLGPELALRCMRVRPGGSPFFQSVFMSRSNYTMNLIAAGSGSVLDIDEYGHSIVYVRFHMSLLSKYLIS